MAVVQFSGVTYHDPGRAYGSYVLYTGADGVTRLIDLNGGAQRVQAVGRAGCGRGDSRAEDDRDS